MNKLIRGTFNLLFDLGVILMMFLLVITGNLSKREMAAYEKVWNSNGGGK